jgi:hypothetical protein
MLVLVLVVAVLLLLLLLLELVASLEGGHQLPPYSGG